MTETATRVPVLTLSLGTKFYVEPANAARIPVQVTMPASWGLVHGILELPCRRLDNDESTIVEVHYQDQVVLVDDLDTVRCDECGTDTSDPETCPHDREHCPECRENGYACNQCRQDARYDAKYAR